jgi:hypothetical protein
MVKTLTKKLLVTLLFLVLTLSMFISRARVQVIKGSAPKFVYIYQGLGYIQEHDVAHAGWTQTRRLEELIKVQAEISGDTYETVIYEWSQKIPLKSLARPEEIAHLVVFLSFNKASYITGAVI